jgi:hypothetical protein
MLAAVLGAVETWPGRAGASGTHCLPASLDRALRGALSDMQAGAKERPP